MRTSVVSDTSFYSAFLSEDEIDDPYALLELLQKYDFFMGKVILNEIMKRHSNLFGRIKGVINFLEEYDYSALLSIVGSKIFKKGEYECIAISYLIYKKSELQSLILDDKGARKFVENNIPELYQFVKYSLRFIVNSCLIDQKISTERVINILKKVKKSVENGNKPFNLTEKKIFIVDQLLGEVDKNAKGGISHISG